jgi:hypothetical protein
MAKRVLALPSTEQLKRSVCDHLIGIHVKRDARPRLIHIHDKLSVPFPFDYFSGRARNGLRALFVEQLQFLICTRSGHLDHAHRRNELWMRAKTADAEVF